MEKTKNRFACLAMLFALCCLTLGLVACGTKTYNITTSIAGVVETKNYNEGDEVTIQADELEGYNFSYWIFGDTLITENPYTFTVNKNTAGTYQAFYEQLENYSVVLSVDGETNQSILVWEGTALKDTTLSSLVSTDTICGWFYDEALTQAVSEDDIVTSDITLYTHTATVDSLQIIANETDENGNVVSYKVVSADLTETEIVVPATYRSLPITEVCFVSDEMKEEIDATATTVTSDETEEDVDDIEDVDPAEDACEDESGAHDGETVGALSYSGSLASIVLPSTVTTLSENAFYGISSLTSINIPDTVTTLNKLVFGYCSSLESINLPDSITSFGEGYTFYGCTSLSSVNSETAGVVDISALSITDLPSRFFYNCSSIVKVYLPETIETFSADSDGRGSQFYNCTSLTTVNSETEGIVDISAYSLTELPAYFFSYCSSIVNVKLPETITNFTTYNGYGQQFRDCTSLSTINSDTEGTINLSNFKLTDLPSCFLYNCSSIVRVYLPETIESFSESTTSNYGGQFYNCTSLTTINSETEGVIDLSAFPLTALYKSSFAYCACTSFIFPTTITTIGDYVIYNWDAMTEITIPATITSIGSSNISYCDSLTNVYFEGDSLENVEFNEYGVLLFDYCPNLEATKTEGGLKYIGTESNPYLFLWGAESTDITSASVNENTKYIVQKAFYQCASLTDVTIPEGVVLISQMAFQECTSITEITLPSTITRGSLRFAFRACSNLVTVTNLGTLPIVEYTFYNCYALDTFTFDNVDENATAVWECTFWGCKSLTSITIPNYVTALGSTYGSCFNGCTALEEVIFEDGCQITDLPNQTFRSCTSLSSIVLPESLTSIGGLAFVSCTSLTSITIPAGVTSIPTSYSFNGASNLATVTIESADVFNAQAAKGSNGKLLNYATTVYVLKSIVDDEANSSAYLQSSTFTMSTDELYPDYYVFTKA